MVIKYLSPFLFVAFGLILPSNVLATEVSDQAGIWLGIDVGAGRVKTGVNGNDKNSSALYLGFKAHYRINAHYLVGLELSGWTIEAGDIWDPSKGEAISQVFVVTQYYPMVDSGLFLKAGGGYASYWNNDPGVSGRDRGTGIIFGGGYDYQIQNNLLLTPFISYGSAETGGDDHNGWALGVGISGKL